MRARFFEAPTLPFVGRDAELAQIGELLDTDECRLLTLVGPGGIGKTRLANEAAACYGARFRQGVVVVALQPLTTGDLIVPAIADALGIHLDLSGDLVSQLLNVLSDKSLLLVLDNCEHLLDSLEIASEIVSSAPGVKLLTTSRERLNLREEWVFEVKGLAFPGSESEPALMDYDSVQLFIEQSRRVQASFALRATDRPQDQPQAIQAVARICRLVGGIPLGIELAASWTRSLSCDLIADELERGLDILEMTTRNMPARHRSMRAALDHSWQLLSPMGQTVFMRLSVFRGGFTLVAAEAVAGASIWLLTALVDKSFVSIDANGRYQLHELLRQFGEEQLKSAGALEATRTAHSAYYAAFLQAKWGPLRTARQVQTLDEIEVEFENVRSAWRTMVEQRNIAELSASIYCLWLYTDLRGRYRDALALFEQAEAMLCAEARDEAAERLYGQLLALRGFFNASLGTLDEGRVIALEGLAILQRVGTAEDVVLAYNSLTLLECFVPDNHAVRRYSEAAVEIARGSPDRWLLARALGPLASAYAREFEGGEAIQREYAELADACGDLWLRGLSLGDVQASAAERLGHYAEARQWMEQAAELCRELGQMSTLGETLRELGRLGVLLNDYPYAAHQFQLGLQILVDTGGYRKLINRTLPPIAQLFAAVGNYEQAIELLALSIDHPDSFEWTRQDAGQLLNTYEARVSETTFDAAVERGRKLDLRSVVQRLLHDLTLYQDAPTPELVDPLTKRELELVRLVNEGLWNRDIAERLYLSPATVKWYLSEIYSKLGVRGRMEAVARARDLYLLP